MELDLNAPHSMGTTIIGVTYDGGVVLGADSRTSTGFSLLYSFLMSLSFIPCILVCITQPLAISYSLGFLTSMGS